MHSPQLKAHVKTFISKFSLSHSGIGHDFHGDELPDTEDSGSIRLSAVIAKPADFHVTKKPAPQTPSLIGKDMVIDGSVRSENNLQVKGTVNGDIECTGDVDISGRVNGNVKGRNVTVKSAEVTGDIAAENMLTLTDSTVNGSISVRTAEISGTVNGNIAAEGLLTITNKAVIQGDIKSSSIAVAQEAVIDGKITIGRK